VQLSKRLVARSHAEREGTGRNSVRTRANGVNLGTRGAGRANEWLESNQARPDLT